jgi:transketolase C-terminal domain/subunit
MNLPITFVSVGCGLGYDHATFTHFTPEDVAIAKCLSHMEVWTCSDSAIAAELSRHVMEVPRLRYIRLERNFLPNLNLTGSNKIFSEGFREFGNSKAKICIVSSGYLTHKAINVMKSNPELEISVVDLIRIKPLSNELLARLNGCKKIITLEEQLLEGGIGSGIIEALSDGGMLADKKIKRMGLLDGFDVFNGDRDYLHESYGLSEKALEQVILE